MNGPQCPEIATINTFYTRKFHKLMQRRTGKTEFVAYMYICMRDVWYARTNILNILEFLSKLNKHIAN